MSPGRFLLLLVTAITFSGAEHHVDAALTAECSFDSDLCGWTQDDTDDFDWTQQAGRTATSNTGPSDDVTGGGQYMYTEISFIGDGEKARLQSPELATSQTTCYTLSFYYHMYGSHIGTLNVYVIQDGATFNTTEPAWSLSDDQGDVWHEAEVVISMTQPYRVIFEGIKSGGRGTAFKGDIAIDEISFLSRSCSGDADDCASSPCMNGGTCVDLTNRYSCTCSLGFIGQRCEEERTGCDFDTNICDFEQNVDDDFDWTLKAGSTLSPNTGPSGDHTSGNGQYIYIETSSPRSAGQVARITTHPISVTSSLCVSFYYHMYGSGIGTLNVIVNDTAKSAGRVVWSQYGERGDVWLQGQFAVDAGPGGGQRTIQIIFEGVLGAISYGDIAIDDVTYISGPCPTQAPVPLPTTTNLPTTPPRSSPTTAPATTTSTPTQAPTTGTATAKATPVSDNAKPLDNQKSTTSFMRIRPSDSPMVSGPTSQTGTNKNSTAAIVGGMVGGVAAIALVVVVVWLILYKTKRIMSKDSYLQHMGIQRDGAVSYNVKAMTVTEGADGGYDNPMYVNGVDAGREETYAEISSA